MKKYLLILVQLLMAFTINAQTYKYAASNLNLRSGPSISSKVLIKIPIGERVKIAKECDCEWIQIYYNGNIGYVSSNYLKSYKNTTNQTYYSKTKKSTVKHYTNSSGQRVQSPTYYNSVPAGATALCRDGTYSFSTSRRGTCSHHGGVAKWF